MCAINAQLFASRRWNARHLPCMCVTCSAIAVCNSQDNHFVQRHHVYNLGSVGWGVLRAFAEKSPGGEHCMYFFYMSSFVSRIWTVLKNGLACQRTHQEVVPEEKKRNVRQTDFIGVWRINLRHILTCLSSPTLSAYSFDIVNDGN